MKKIEIITGLSSVLIALCALLFSVYSFKTQQEREDLRATKSAQPILKIRTINYDGKLGIKLVNVGLGPAIITEARFTKNDITTNKIYRFLKINKAFETYINIPKKTVLKPNEERILAFVSTSQGYTDAEFGEISQLWHLGKMGIKVHIDYQDIYGSKYGPYKTTLK
ncbi:hypothetical protein ACNKU7_06135 [Microbulbifer sp. SA54]|uniref:hypothetical protein n=1 Tax=Microbulbifer sp. SA54 TaxID=3401577 RepID=UPI003AAEFA9C